VIKTQKLIEKLLAMASDPSASKAERQIAQSRAIELMTEMLAGRPVPY
jgi:hypothetical protein